jgi:hypothetical protein
MKTHIIYNGVCINSISASIAEAQNAFPGLVYLDGEIYSGGIGYTWDGSNFTGPAVTETKAQAKVRLLLDVKRFTDEEAQTQGFDDLLEACLFSFATNTALKNKGLAARVWKEDIKLYLKQVIQDVQNDVRPIPTTDELIAELPTITWP